MENTKNAVYIEVLLKVIDEEVNELFESMRKTQRLYDFEMSQEIKNKKQCSFWKKMLERDKTRWSTTYQYAYLLKTKLGIL